MTYTEKTVRIYERIMSGAQTKYEKKIHIQKLLNLFSTGANISSFCAEVEICRDTFYEWVKKHKDFREAFKIAEQLALEWFESEALRRMDDPSFNLALWSLIMKNRFGLTNERKVKIQRMKNANTPLDQMKVLRYEISEGGLTAAETTHMANFVATGVKIDEHTALKDDVEELKKIHMDGKR